MAGGGTSAAKALKSKGATPGPGSSSKTKAAFTRMKNKEAASKPGKKKGK